MVKKQFALRFFSFCAIWLIGFTARAQYVSIPDTSFGSFLNGNGFSACMTGNNIIGWRLDTTCSAVQTATSITCTYDSVHDFTGVVYFRRLDTLMIDYNLVNTLPVLPAALTYLSCTYNQLTALQSLPPGLISLACDQNYITSLPALPSSLQLLSCWGNQLTLLPTLPDSIQILTCTNNPLTALPNLPSMLTLLNCNSTPLTSLPGLPSSLHTLSCQYCALTSLPTLPDSLNELYCDLNQLTSLPSLPAALTDLTCNDNPLGALPPLPAALIRLDCVKDGLTALPLLPDSLYILGCDSNQLVSLPALPATLINLTSSYNQLSGLPAIPSTLQWLDCHHNQLATIPPLSPALTFLDCSYNQISSLPLLLSQLAKLTVSNNPLLSCLPFIYQNPLEFFYIANTSIRCLPNRFSSWYYDINPDTMPLCLPSSGCGFYFNIAGNVYSDTLATCLPDSVFAAHAMGGIKVNLMENGQVIQQFYTLGSGEYSFKTDSLSTYTVAIDTTGLPFKVACPLSGINDVILTPGDSIQAYENFGMQCKPVDYAVVSIAPTIVHPFRTSIQTPVIVFAGNAGILTSNVDCGSGTGGTITVTLSGPVQYGGPFINALTPSSVSGGTITYNVANLDLLQPGNIAFLVSADSGAVIGTPVCITGVITPATPDANLRDDTLTYCGVIHDPHDPNLKEVYPTDSVADGNWLTYTIHFQNTGNDTAYNVVVNDTLSPNLDMPTFQYLASSNPMVIQLTGNAAVFTFPKINLVDSATNPPLSQGWIQYKVKTKVSLPTGTQIANTAYVYFDANAPVVTNTTVNVADSLVSSTAPLATLSISNSWDVSLYPNPNNGHFTIAFTDEALYQIEITDAIGRTMMPTAKMQGQKNFDLAELSSGIYFMLINHNGLVKSMKFSVVK